MESQGVNLQLGDSDLPDYVCCVVTESVWTWFLTVILSVLLFALATLRYCKRHLGSEKFHAKNQHLLARQLVKSISSSSLLIDHFKSDILERLYGIRRSKIKDISDVSQTEEFWSHLPNLYSLFILPQISLFWQRVKRINPSKFVSDWIWKGGSSHPEGRSRPRVRVPELLLAQTKTFGRHW